MTKRLLLISSFLIFICSGLNAQVTLFAEDFETYGPQLKLENNTANPGWRNFNIEGTDNSWWVFDDTYCNTIDVSGVDTSPHSMAISRNNPFSGNGTKPRYNRNSASQNIAKRLLQMIMKI